jgi:hypothetical protein
MNEKKVELPEAYFIVSYVAFTDAVGISLALVGLDDFFIIDALTFPVTQLYFRMRGIKGSYDLYGNVAELIPYVGALPIRTAGVLFTIWAANHPESTIAKTTQLKALKGGKPSSGKIKKAA